MNQRPGSTDRVKAAAAAAGLAIEIREMPQSTRTAAEAATACGCSVAVANAIPMVKEGADIVTSGARGAGVVELMSTICAKDAAIVPATGPLAIVTFWLPSA